jgi:hypothetical protein
MTKKISITGFAISMLLLLTACETEQQSISRKLTGAAWTPTEVKRDGMDITVEYALMRLTFDANTYSTTNGSLAWPSSGTWTFREGSNTTILRDNAVIINFVLSTDAKALNMDFVIAERKYTPGRVTALEGEYHFRFIRP